MKSVEETIKELPRGLIVLQLEWTWIEKETTIYRHSQKDECGKAYNFVVYKIKEKRLLILIVGPCVLNSDDWLNKEKDNLLFDGRNYGKNKKP